MKLALKEWVENVQTAAYNSSSAVKYPKKKNYLDQLNNHIHPTFETTIIV